MMPSNFDLQYFLEVAYTHNISRAAERLGISQPSLSLSMKRLESSLGTPLLVRSKSGVQLTQSGQKLVVQARQLLGEWEKLLSDTARTESDVTGRYVIGCHASVALYSLPHFLPRLMEEHRGLEIKLVHDLSRKITEEVISFRVDFGIVVNPVNHPDLVIRQLALDEVSLWVGRGKFPNVLIADPDLLQTQSLLKQLQKSGHRFASHRFDRVIFSSNLEVIAALVASGAGVGILPTRVATRIKTLGLKLYSPTAPKFHDRLALIYRADAQKNKASRIISKSIETAFK